MAGDKRRTKEPLTKQLRIQAAIAREERAKTNALFDSIGEGVIATDELGVIVRVNQVAMQILGLEKKALVGKWFHDVVLMCYEDGSPVEATNRPIYKTMLSGKTTTEDGFFKLKSGILIPVSMIVSPVMHHGKPVGALEIFRDIKKDMEADRLKTEFISIASHQLRTPLSAINTYAFLLKEGYGGKLNNDQLSFLSIIISACKRMNELISSLLNITRVEGGKLTIVAQPIDLSKVIRKSIREFDPQIKKKNINLISNIDKDIDIVETDQLIVGEIIDNLISNAYKYTPENGTIEITLSTQGDNVVFKIKDSGYGIPSEMHDLVFSKFFRGSNIVDREVSGTGLGLYLVKILVENIKGELWFHSEEDKGTTFYLSLPKKGLVSQQGRFKLESKR